MKVSILYLEEDMLRTYKLTPYTSYLADIPIILSLFTVVNPSLNPELSKVAIYLRY